MAAFSVLMFSRVWRMASMRFRSYSATSLTNSSRFSRSEMLVALNSTDQ